MGQSYWYKDVLPFSAMVAAEITNVGLNILFKTATLKGMSNYVFIIYSYTLATLILLASAFMFHSKEVLPPLKFTLVLKICTVGIIGISGMILAYKGIANGSPTLASAMSNLSPALTFILAVIFRLERLVFRSIRSQAKIIGTILSISGALVVILYKGLAILPTSTPTTSISPQQSPALPLSNWVIGSLQLCSAYTLFSIDSIIQTQIIRAYHSEFRVLCISTFCATIVGMPVCFVIESNMSAWRLETEGALVAVIYSGVFGSFFYPLVHIWCLHSKGPVYVAAFKPISIAIAAFSSFLFLGDALYLGSVIGASAISIGFYAVIWGKAKEEEETIEDCGFNSLEASCDDRIPLLQGHKTLV